MCLWQHGDRGTVGLEKVDVVLDSLSCQLDTSGKMEPRLANSFYWIGL